MAGLLIFSIKACGKTHHREINAAMNLPGLGNRVALAGRYRRQDLNILSRHTSPGESHICQIPRDPLAYQFLGQEEVGTPKWTSIS